MRDILVDEIYSNKIFTTLAILNLLIYSVSNAQISIYDLLSN